MCTPRERTVPVATYHTNIQLHWLKRQVEPTTLYSETSDSAESRKAQLMSHTWISTAWSSVQAQDHVTIQCLKNEAKLSVRELFLHLTSCVTERLTFARDHTNASYKVFIGGVDHTCAKCFCKHVQDVHIAAFRVKTTRDEVSLYLHLSWLN